MRGDDFKRGSSGEDDTTPDEVTRPDLTPPAGRDKALMFWETIGMKPGDDWKKEARHKRGGENGS